MGQERREQGKKGETGKRGPAWKETRRVEEQGRSPSPREYTLKPDTFLARTDLGRLRRAGL